MRTELVLLRNMKRLPKPALLFTLTLLLISTCPATANSQDTWTTKTSMPSSSGPFSGNIASLNGLAYAAIILSSTGNHIEMYNPVTDSWTNKSKIPIEKGSYETAASDNKIHVFSNEHIDHYAYDPQTDTWTTLANSRDIRVGWQANVVDEKIYVIGGGQLGVSFWFAKTNWVYDPATDAWSQIAALPVNVAFYASAVLDGEIYIIGGSPFSELEYPNPHTITWFSNLVQIYNPQTNLWRLGSPLPANMSGMGAVATTGTGAPERIYVFGGRVVDKSFSPPHYPAVNSTYIFDPQTGNWTEGIPMLTARYGASVVNLNDELYVMGGGTYDLSPFTGSFDTLQTDNFKYTPADYAPQNTPTPTASPSPHETTPIPTMTPTASTEPTASPKVEPTRQTNSYWIIAAAIAVAVTATMVFVLAMNRKKRK